MFPNQESNVRTMSTSTGGAASLAPIKPQTETSREFLRLDQHTTTLLVVIKQLTDKLTPLLGSARESAGDTDRETGPSTDLGRAIRTQDERVDNQSRDLVS